MAGAGASWVLYQTILTKGRRSFKQTKQAEAEGGAGVLDKVADFLQFGKNRYLVQRFDRQCCDATEGLDEFEEKIDAIDSTRDGSHPWLEDLLHQLRRAKQEAEAGGGQGEAGATGDQGAPHLLLDTADGGGAGDGDTDMYCHG